MEKHHLSFKISQRKWKVLKFATKKWYYGVVVISITKSINGVPIRLTQERWNHITTSHLEINPKDYKAVLNIIKSPDAVLKGDTGELLAIKKQPRKSVWNVVAYKEVSKEDGFILTAYLTTDTNWLFRREIIWNKE